MKKNRSEIDDKKSLAKILLTFVFLGRQVHNFGVKRNADD